MCFECFAVGVLDYTQWPLDGPSKGHLRPLPDLTAITTHRANHRWSVVIIGAVAPGRRGPAFLVGTPTGRIGWVPMFLTLFPPHSETSHPFQSFGHEVAFWAVISVH